MNRCTMRPSRKCQDLFKAKRENGREGLYDPGRSPIDSVAMGTGVQIKGIIG